MRRVLPSVLAAVILGTACYGQPDLEARRPNFGVILNDDGDLSFVSPDPKLAERILRLNINGDAALGIGTLVYCVGSGSDVLNYPTKAASTVGWRTTTTEKDSQTWTFRMENARKAIAAGMDAVRIAGEEAKRNGLRFLPSLRMNDSHFMSKPFDYPLTGEFWLKNYANLRIKDSPVSFQPNYANLFDFRHEEVRNYRLAVINEVIDRNLDLIDGFELDFNRVQVFFPKDKADEGAPLMTDLVRKVRQRLDQVSAEQGRPMSLFVRIPTSLAACKLAGLEVQKWMEEGLVDLVSPAQLMTLAHDMPIRDLIADAHRFGVLVYPSLYPRTSFRVPLDFTEPNLGLDLRIDRSAVKAEVLAAAANYRAMGADGFYLFNFYGTETGTRPHPDWMYALVASLKSKTPDASPKTFAITKTYYYDNVEPSYAYVKQLPATVTGSQTFPIEIGELPADIPLPLKGCVLRLGLRSEEGQPKVELNGKELPLYKSFLTPKPGKKPLPPDAASRNDIFLIEDPTVLRRGTNDVTISGDTLDVTDLEIAFAHENRLSRLLMTRSPETFPAGTSTKTSKENQDE